MRSMRTLRRPLLWEGLITVLLVAGSVGLGAFSSGDEATGEVLQPLSPSGSEQLVGILTIVVVFAVVFALALLSSWLRSSRQMSRSAK